MTQSRLHTNSLTHNLGSLTTIHGHFWTGLSLGRNEWVHDVRQSLAQFSFLICKSRYVSSFAIIVGWSYYVFPSALTLRGSHCSFGFWSTLTSVDIKVNFSQQTLSCRYERCCAAFCISKRLICYQHDLDQKMIRETPTAFLCINQCAV